MGLLLMAGTVQCSWRCRRNVVRGGGGGAQAGLCVREPWTQPPWYLYPDHNDKICLAVAC